LLRLVEPNEGKIIIDGVDLAKIPRAVVRKRLICIAQEAAFVGTFRFNLDPEDEIEDEHIREALRMVGVLDLVEKRGGLTSDMQAETLSHGEQQLIAVARAILRRRTLGGKCVLVLDEATSDLDEATEALVRDLLWKEFEGNTIIVVAHRPEAVHDVDFVITLEKGEVLGSG
jgi:ABC-type multidrug transport system fused ATPase/permease subunit